MGHQFLQADEGTVVLIRAKGAAPLLGIVVHCEAEEGLVFPTVSVASQGRQLPALLLAEADDDAILQFELTELSYSTYFAPESRQRLAAAYRQACLKFGWQLDDLATLNVVFYLEASGITEVDNTNLQAALDVMITIRQAFYGLIDLLAGAQRPGMGARS